MVFMVHFSCTIDAVGAKTEDENKRIERDSKFPTAAQQGAAPDRLQLRSSFLLAKLPAAGELGRCIVARGIEVSITIRVMDTEPDYSEYSLDDLHDVEQRIDRVKYADRYNMVVQEIAKRGEQSTTPSNGASSQEDDLTASIVLCGLCAMPVLSILVHLFNWLFLPQLLRDGQYVMLFPGGTFPFGWLIGAAVGYALASSPKKFKARHSVILAAGFFIIAPVLGLFFLPVIALLDMLFR